MRRIGTVYARLRRVSVERRGDQRAFAKLPIAVGG
jgi:hypothetical protein